MLLVVVVVDGGKTETRLFFNQVPNLIELPGIKGQRTHGVKITKIDRVHIVGVGFFYSYRYTGLRVRSKKTKGSQILI